jgi:hypothetical protein
MVSIISAKGVLIPTNINKKFNKKGKYTNRAVVIFFLLSVNWVPVQINWGKHFRYFYYVQLFPKCEIPIFILGKVVESDDAMNMIKAFRDLKVWNKMLSYKQQPSRSSQLDIVGNYTKVSLESIITTILSRSLPWISQVRKKQRDCTTLKPQLRTIFGFIALAFSIEL